MTVNGTAAWTEDAESSAAAGTATHVGIIAPTGGYVTFPGVTNNVLTTPHSAAYQVTKLTLIVRLRPTTWTPSTNKYIVARTSGGNTFRMSLLATTGAIYLGTYNSGGTETSRNSNAYIAASGVVAGDWLWIAASNDPDDGATHSVFRLYWSRDGATWTSFLTSTSAAATNIATATTPTLEIGATNGAQAWSGDIGYVAVRDGVGAAGVVGGTDVFRTDGVADLAGVAAAANTYVAATGQTVTVGHSGGTPTVIVPTVPNEDADTSAAAGAITRVATVAWTEGADQCVAAGASTHAATVAWTEDADSGVAAGYTPNDGPIVYTEDDDTVVAAGGSTHEGIAAWLEADDTMVAAAASTHAGPIAWLEADDTAAAAGTATHTGTIAWPEAADTCVAAGKSYPPGTVAWTEDADTAAAAGTATHVATLAWTEADDALLAAAVATRTATVAWTEADDLMVVDGFAGYRAAATSTGTITTTASTGSIRTLAGVGAITTTEVE